MKGLMNYLEVQYCIIMMYVENTITKLAYTSDFDFDLITDKTANARISYWYELNCFSACKTKIFIIAQYIFDFKTKFKTKQIISSALQIIMLYSQSTNWDFYSSKSCFAYGSKSN